MEPGHDLPRALVESPLLHGLSEAHRKAVLEAGLERRIARGEQLFHEGARAEGLWLLGEGLLKLVRHGPDGRELLLHLVRPGQTFAEAALFGRQTYPATAVALERSRAWCWPTPKLLALLRASPELGLGVLVSLSAWARRLADKLELLTQRRVEERLAIYLAGRCGGRPLPGCEVRLEEPRHLIAAQLGTAPEVLSRTFRRLQDEGVLDVRGDLVRVMDPARLAALAGGSVSEPRDPSRRG